MLGQSPPRLTRCTAVEQVWICGDPVLISRPKIVTPPGKIPLLPIGAKAGGIGPIAVVPGPLLQELHVVNAQ